MKRQTKKTRQARGKHQDGLPSASTDSAPGSALSTGRRWLFRLLALVVLPVVLCAGLEGALRIVGYGYTTSLFEKIRVHDQDWLVNNDTFSLRFFPPEIARSPRAIAFPAEKPARAFRIFILGESAAMGDPEPAYGASRYLEILLRERFPGQKFEIINTAFTAINSHVILPIARECAQQQGDLWIVYMGNNEMVGPFGAATVFGAQAPPLSRVRLTLGLQQTRVGQLLMALARKVHGKAGTASSWGGMEMFLGNRLSPDDPRKQTVYRNFQGNLHAIVQAGLDSGAKVLLNTVAVNLRDCPPFASLTNRNLPDVERIRFDQFLAEGAAASARGDAGGAAQRFEQAAQMDPRHAEVQYRWGDSLVRMTNYATGREHLQRACDADALVFRADSSINRLIIEEGSRRASENLVLLDTAAVLGTNETAGVCGRESFYEHVHFNFSGNYRLGRIWAEQVERLLPAAARSPAANGWAEQETCERLLGLTDWNRLFVIQGVIRRLKKAPLSGQINNANRLEMFQAQAKELSDRANNAAAERARSELQAAVAHAPADHYLHENFADFLEAVGDLAGATAEWQRVQELEPHDFLASFQIGRLLARQGKPGEAEACLLKAVALHPILAEGWFELGNLEFADGKFEPALEHYDRAQRLRPQDATFGCCQARTLSKLNRRADAIAAYRRVIEFTPDAAEAHFELGNELAADNRKSEAKNEYEEAIRLRPAYSQAHLNLGVLLAVEGQFDNALQQFSETLRLEPGNQVAQEYLTRVQGWKHGQR
jgi:tetratricopeptide (TPR) repeat protein